MAISDEARRDLRAHTVRALRDVLQNTDVTDGMIRAALGKLEWDRVGCRVLEDVLDEENSDAILELTFPKLQELVDRIVPRWLGWLPFVDVAGRLRDALDDALPELVRDPLLELVCGDEA